MNLLSITITIYSDPRAGLFECYKDHVLDESELYSNPSHKPWRKKMTAKSTLCCNFVIKQTADRSASKMLKRQTIPANTETPSLPAPVLVFGISVFVHVINNLCDSPKYSKPFMSLIYRVKDCFVAFHNLRTALGKGVSNQEKNLKYLILFKLFHTL